MQRYSKDDSPYATEARCFRDLNQGSLCLAAKNIVGVIYGDTLKLPVHILVG